jgi:hypothetical protein
LTTYDFEKKVITALLYIWLKRPISTASFCLIQLPVEDGVGFQTAAAWISQDSIDSQRDLDPAPLLFYIWMDDEKPQRRIRFIPELRASNLKLDLIRTWGPRSKVLPIKTLSGFDLQFLR